MSEANTRVKDALREMAELTALDEQNVQAFRVRAYERAADMVAGMSQDVGALDERELAELPGIGKTIASKIRELLTTGRIAKLEALREAFPPSVVAISRIPGIGPKRLAAMREQLGIDSIADLRAALEAKTLRKLSGFGAKTEANLRQSLAELGDAAGTEQRTPRAVALPVAERVVAALRQVEGVRALTYCGSLRREAKTIGDVDVVCAAEAEGPVSGAFMALPFVARVLVHGDTKTSVVTHDGLQIDLRVVTEEQYGAALLYFTGSKSHNILLRQRALQQGMTLNEYGLFREDDETCVASRTEEEIYAALGFDWIPPDRRLGGDELQRYARE